MGTVLAFIVVFLTLALVSQSAGYYRRRFSVADSEVAESESVAASAAVGVGAGVVVLLLLLVLYLGITRWDWVGPLSPGSAPLLSPVPIASPANPAIGGSPESTPSASPSATATP
jgi:hypothetical protein